MMIFAPGPAGAHGQGRFTIANNLLGRLVHANQRVLRVVVLAVDVEDLLHVRHKFAPDPFPECKTVASARA